MAFIHPKYGLVTPAPDTRVNKLGHELKQLGESLEGVLEGIDGRATAAQTATQAAQSSAAQANATATAVSAAVNVAKGAAQTAQAQAQQAQQQAQAAQQAAAQVAQATSNVETYIDSKVSTIAAATTARQGITRLATVQEVALGAATDKAVTPHALKNGVSIDGSRITTGTVPAGRLPAATTGGRGTLQIATQQEVNAGTVTNKAVTPATLKGRAQAALWSGSHQLHQNQYITLSEAVSAQMTGIVLVFAAIRDGQVQPWDTQTHVVPAGLVAAQPGREYTFLLATTGRTGLKVVKIEDTKITGTHHNSAPDSGFFALIAVYAI